MAEQAGQFSQPTQGRPRLGGFELGVRDSTFSQQGTTVAIHATGVPGTPYAGYPATCYCRPFAPETSAALVATPWFEQSRAIRHDRLTPVIDAGVAGQTAFFVEPAIAGERISQRLRNRTETTPVQAGRMLADIHEALTVAWSAGFNLIVAPDTVRILPNGRVQLSLALSMCLNPKAGPGSEPAAQFQMACLVMSLFSGLIDLSPLGIEKLNGPDRMMAMSGFRERMGNLAEHVALVLAKAVNPDPGQRYPSAHAFLVAYGEALKATADELAFGAIEAKNQDGSAMAAVYAELIRRYDENHPEVVGPGGRLNGSFESTPMPVMPRVQPPLPQPQIEPIPAQPAPSPPMSLGGEPPLSPEIAAMLAGPVYEVSRPKNNPWFTFAAGTVLILVFFLFVAFLMISNS
jgi:hypothetical protein